MILVLLSILLSTPFVVRAESSFVTRTPNRYDELTVTKDAYEPVEEIRTFGINQRFNEARDMFVDDMDWLYVANTKDQEILIFDETNDFVLSFGSDVLMSPTGLFVRDHVIYVADYGAPEDNQSGRIHRFAFDRKTLSVTLIDSLPRPDSPVLRINDFVYRPQKIAVDDNLTMYVVSEGSYNGLLMINDENRFLSFFAPNPVRGSLMDYVLQFLYGNNENARLTKKIPPSVSNVHLDGSGYIYTVTQTTIEDGFGDTLKKVNIGGINFYPTDMIAAEDFVAVATGHVENVYALTRAGFVFEYDREGTLLFVFAGSAQGTSRLGLFKNASGIATRSNGDLLILDQANNNIHVLRPTHFGQVVHEALGLYNQGKYVESQVLWEEVMRYNALFDLAHKGVGLSYYMQGDFEQAMEKFLISESKTEYSNAYWEVRNVYLLSHAGLFMVGVLLLSIGLMIVGGIDRRTAFLNPMRNSVQKIGRRPMVRELGALFYFVKNPADACYEVKVRDAVRIRTAVIYIGLLVLVYTIHLLFTGLLFTDRVLERTVYTEELMKVLIPFVSFVLGNYLVSSLMDGEGTLKAVFVNTLGALVPVLIILPVMTVLSNVLTYNEAFLYQFLLVAMIIWTAVLIFFAIKETHHYTIRETVYNILLTALMMVVMILASIMVYFMVRQVIDFIGDLMKEAIIRG